MNSKLRDLLKIEFEKRDDYAYVRIPDPKSIHGDFPWGWISMETTFT